MKLNILHKKKTTAASYDLKLAVLSTLIAAEGEKKITEIQNILMRISNTVSTNLPCQTPLCITDHY